MPGGQLLRKLEAHDHLKNLPWVLTPYLDHTETRQLKGLQNEIKTDLLKSSDYAFYLEF